MSFLLGLFTGAIGVLVIVYFVYRNNKKKIKKLSGIL
jgi:hypothetical protein